MDRKQYAIARKWSETARDVALKSTVGENREDIAQEAALFVLDRANWLYENGYTRGPVALQNLGMVCMMAINHASNVVAANYAPCGDCSLWAARHSQEPVTWDSIHGASELVRLAEDQGLTPIAIEGESYLDVAKVLQMSKQAVHKIVNRSREDIRKEYFD